MSHEVVEKNVGLMAILIVLVISVGGLVEIVPLFFLSGNHGAGRRRRPSTPPCVWKDATSTSAKAATTATRR